MFVLIQVKFGKISLTRGHNLINDCQKLVFFFCWIRLKILCVNKHLSASLKVPQQPGR